MALRSPNCISDLSSLGVSSQSFFLSFERRLKYSCSSWFDSGRPHNSHHSRVLPQWIYFWSCWISNQPLMEPMVWRALISEPLIISETKITILTKSGLTNALESDLDRWRHICDVRSALSGENEWEEKLENWWRSCSERRCDNILMGRVVHVICEVHRSLAGILSVRNLFARCHLLQGEAFESTPDGVYGGSCSI